MAVESKFEPKNMVRVTEDWPFAKSTMIAEEGCGPDFLS